MTKKLVTVIKKLDWNFYSLMELVVTHFFESVYDENKNLFNHLKANL